MFYDNNFILCLKRNFLKSGACEYVILHRRILTRDHVFNSSEKDGITRRYTTMAILDQRP